MTHLKSTTADLKKLPKLASYLMQCSKENCQTCLPSGLPNDKFHRSHHLPDPLSDPDEKQYKPFAYVYSTNTTEEHMPPLKTV